MTLKDFYQDFLKGQKRFGEDIAAIINSVILTFVYLLGVGLTSLVARIFGKKFLDMKTVDKEESYWTPLNLSKKELNDYYKQF